MFVLKSSCKTYNSSSGAGVVNIKNINRFNTNRTFFSKQSLEELKENIAILFDLFFEQIYEHWEEISKWVHVAFISALVHNIYTSWTNRVLSPLKFFRDEWSFNYFMEETAALNPLNDTYWHWFWYGWFFGPPELDFFRSPNGSVLSFQSIPLGYNITFFFEIFCYVFLLFIIFLCWFLNRSFLSAELLGFFENFFVRSSFRLDKKTYLNYIVFFFIMFFFSLMFVYNVLAANYIFADLFTTSSVKFKLDFFLIDPFTFTAKQFLIVFFLFSYPLFYKNLNFEIVSTGYGVTYSVFYLSAFFFLIFLTSVVDLVLIFIIVELISLSVIILLSLKRDGLVGLRVSAKSFFFNALPSLFFIFGCTLVYSIFATCNLFDIAALLKQNPVYFYSHYWLIVCALLCFVCFFLYKLGCFPFHFWVPDVYAGADWLLFWFLNTCYKLVLYLVFLRVVFFSFSEFLGSWFIIFMLISGLGSLIWGAVAAVKAQDLKKFFAYLSISNTGLVLLLLTSSDVSLAAAWGLLYLLYYFVAFTLLMLLFLYVDPNIFESESFHFFKNIDLFCKFRALKLDFYFFLALASLAGLPPFPSFFFKFKLLKLIFLSNFWFSIFVVLLSQVILLYAYWRLFGSLSVSELRRLALMLPSIWFFSFKKWIFSFLRGDFVSARSVLFVYESLLFFLLIFILTLLPFLLVFIFPDLGFFFFNALLLLVESALNV